MQTDYWEYSFCPNLNVQKGINLLSSPFSLFYTSFALVSDIAAVGPACLWL